LLAPALLEGSRIDREQVIALLHEVAFVELHFGDDPVTCERTLTDSNASTLPIAATSTGTSAAGRWPW
jgi:hypothetical protein